MSHCSEARKRAYFSWQQELLYCSVLTRFKDITIDHVDQDRSNGSPQVIQCESKYFNHFERVGESSILALDHLNQLKVLDAKDLSPRHKILSIKSEVRSFTLNPYSQPVIIDSKCHSLKTTRRRQCLLYDLKTNKKVSDSSSRLQVH